MSSASSSPSFQALAMLARIMPSFLVRAEGLEVSTASWASATSSGLGSPVASPRRSQRKGSSSSVGSQTAAMLARRDAQGVSCTGRWRLVRLERELCVLWWFRSFGMEL